MLWVGLDGKSALQRAGVKRLSICYAVRDVDGTGTGQASWQRHALQSRSAGLASVLTVALVGLCVTVSAACL